MYRQSEKNLLSSNTSSTCPDNMVNFDPLTAEIGYNQIARRVVAHCTLHQKKRVMLIAFWVTVCKTVRPVLSDRCLSVCPVCPVLSVQSVMSVTLMYCGQTVGRIKMKLGMRVGLGHGHILLDGNPAILPQRGTAPQFLAYICISVVAQWLDGLTCHLVWR